MRTCGATRVASQQPGDLGRGRVHHGEGRAEPECVRWVTPPPPSWRSRSTGPAGAATARGCRGRCERRPDHHAGPRAPCLACNLAVTSAGGGRRKAVRQAGDGTVLSSSSYTTCSVSVSGTASVGPARRSIGIASASRGGRVPSERVHRLVGFPDRDHLPPPVAHRHRDVLLVQPHQLGMNSVCGGAQPCGRRCSARNRIGATSRPQVQQARVGRGRSAASSQRVGSLDHLIRSREHRRRDRETQRLGGLRVDDQFELGGLLDGEVGGLGPLEDLVDVDGRLA
jgi:hypothetical protein